ncbi:MAG: hypothetical protein AB8F94_19080 [Saprospiraceae bacterium]
MSYFNGINKYTLAGFSNKIESDNLGGIFITTDKDVETILHLNEHYHIIKEIKISGLTNCANFEENRIDPKYQRIYSISYIDNLLLVSLTDNTTVVVDYNGNILSVLKTHVLAKDKVGGTNYSLRCIFKKQADGNILILANSKSHGSQLAKSSINIKDLPKNEMIDSVFITDTYTSPELYMLPLAKMKMLKKNPSLGEEIQAKAHNYLMDKNPEKEYFHFVDDMRIWDMVEMGNEHVLLFLYTNLANKSNQPNINMPYFLCKLNISNGEIVKMISPSDRTIFKLNLFPRFIINDGRIIFKTMTALYEISEELSFQEIYLIPEKSMFKKLFPVAFDRDQIHFVNPDQGELFSYSNKKRIELEVDNLLKTFRKDKKDFKNNME